VNRESRAEGEQIEGGRREHEEGAGERPVRCFDWLGVCREASPRTFTLDFLTSDRMRVLMASRGDPHVNARVLWRKRRLKDVQPEVGNLSQQMWLWVRALGSNLSP
jgi:hypothetical protein